MDGQTEAMLRSAEIVENEFYGTYNIVYFEDYDPEYLTINNSFSINFEQALWFRDRKVAEMYLTVITEQ